MLCFTIKLRTETVNKCLDEFEQYINTKSTSTYIIIQKLIILPPCFVGSKIIIRDNVQNHIRVFINKMIFNDQEHNFNLTHSVLE